MAIGVRSQLRKLAPARIIDSLRAAGDADVIVLDWVNRGEVRTNWGDAIAPELVTLLSGRRVVNRRDIVNLKNRVVYTGIGSLLGSQRDAGFQVWGSGFVDSKARLRAQPGRIHVVRGPLTRQKLMDEGIQCPEFYGDPALLAPHLYDTKASREFDIGFIPHFKEKGHPSTQRLRQMGFHIIDIQGGIQHVIDEINRCNRIISSSLHGLVAADSYRIPAMWVKLSDRPYGDGFKFIDYLLSTQRSNTEPIQVRSDTGRSEVEDLLSRSLPNPQAIEDLTETLLSRFPFPLLER